MAYRGPVRLHYYCQLEDFMHLCRYRAGYGVHKVILEGVA